MTSRLTSIDGGGGVPPEPDWSLIYSDQADIDAASEEWHLIVNEMRTAGTIAVVNGHAIQRLVAFRLIYERASRDVAENGAVIKAKKTAVPAYNCHWVVMRQADEAVRAIEGELGLSPIKRSRATKATRGKASAKPSDAYIKRNQ